MPAQFYLASRSPRRVQLLRSLGFAFYCLPADVPEIPQRRETPQAFAQRMALEKARAAFARAPRGLPIIGADTDVSIDGQIMGKPRDREDAMRMLALLSGRTHQVSSAVAVVHEDQVLEALTVTEVSFGEITPQQASDYWDTGEPADKAGAYAVQGGAVRWVREIHGSYNGVVGLPLFEVCQLLAQLGIEPRPVVP